VGRCRGCSAHPQGNEEEAELRQIVGYWRVWHATKIAISGLAVVVLIMLTVGLWRRYAMTWSRHWILPAPYST